MTKGDLIYCYGCEGISIDTNELKLQDSRYNPKWNYRCAHCHGFHTVNASQFLEEGKIETFTAIAKSKNLVALKQQAKELKALGIIKGFKIVSRRPTNVLYARRRLRRELQKVVKKWEQNKSFK